MEEAQFFGIESIVPSLEMMAKEQLSKNKDRPISRHEVIHALLSTSPSTELRFQGVNLTGADLSKLDLRNINFKVLQSILTRLKKSSYEVRKTPNKSEKSLEFWSNA